MYLLALFEAVFEAVFETLKSLIYVYIYIHAFARICSSVGTGSAIRLEQCWDTMNSGENTFKSWTDTMQHGDGMREK